MPTSATAPELIPVVFMLNTDVIIGLRTAVVKITAIKTDIIVSGLNLTIF